MSSVHVQDILTMVESQNQWRGQECINLIASENTPSPTVRMIQNSDFMGRYAEGHPNTEDHINRYYQGTRYIDQIETLATQEIKELFQCKQMFGLIAGIMRIRPLPWDIYGEAIQF